ncbi:unnamed protein product [Cylindrotheca closterium]|uniref:glucan endo-1,3-beta-D-glucosidase n=1 Tax=Cylindrotheca closterium TaxID=2856 RepID=A0AAD2FKM8_9STRA|nr:unnamed protein product [Cylindrotheca closterium]
MSNDANQYHRTSGSLNVKSSYGSINHYNGVRTPPRSPMPLRPVKENESLNFSLASMGNLLGTKSSDDNNDDGDDNNNVNTPRKRCTMAHWVLGLVIVIYSLLICVFIIGKKSRAPSSLDSPSDGLASGGLSKIPFPSINRSEFGKNPQSASSIVNPDLFASGLLGEGKSLLKVPFPTGAFWTNLVIQPTADRELSFPIMAYPYAYKWNPTMLQVSVPSLYSLMDAISLRHIFMADLTLSVADQESISKRFVHYFDPLSVTLRYESSNTTKYWETFVVQGSPYITAKYENMIPKIRALSIFHSISCLGTDGDTCVELESDESTKTIRLNGTQFALETNENLTWLVFSSEPITLVFDNIRKTTVKTENSFTGILRLALVPPHLEETIEYTSQMPQSYESVDLDGSTGVSQLIEHANSYPTGVALSWSFPSKDMGALAFDFKVKEMTSRDSSTSTLLMLALPHHVDILSQQSSKKYTLLSNKNQFDLIYETIKGPMKAVVGNSWILPEELTTVGFDHDYTLKKAYGLNNATKSIIMDQVVLDVKRVLPTMDENVYGYGKQVARLAQLINIAKTLTADQSGFGNKYTSAIHDAQLVLHHFLSAFLSGETDDSLVFDSDFGGLVTKDGLDDYMNDFGNGWYNDHHFHYGYYLYASALMGQWNETFVDEYGEYVDAMMYDVTDQGTGSSKDFGNGAFFPLARHKAWFDGHSFASGLFPFASGKSMESSSESINCYYGAYLWNMVRGTSNLQSDNFNFARLLLATELRGVQTYWHMHSVSNTSIAKWQTLYNPVLTKNLMIGNLGMMDVTVSTWFGNNPLYVHMINFLPVTPITRELFTTEYVEEEFNNVIEPMYNNVEMAWKGYVVCDLALLDPNKAFQDALKLRSFELDQAISQSQVLYFASTMASFDDSNITASNDDSSTGSDMNSPYCADHPGCNSLALTGLCCPAPSGANLGCCGSKSSAEGGNTTNATETTSNESDSDSSCSLYEACEAAGLSGSCCPTEGGVQLLCCDS